jgi:hypothetical protein
MRRLDGHLEANGVIEMCAGPLRPTYLAGALFVLDATGGVALVAFDI